MQPISAETLIQTPPKTSLWMASLVCILAAMFYLYEFILQVSPSVMTTELMRDLHLDAASLGVMSAFYYYAYTPMQLPAGLLYDRFGPRLLITIAVIICAAGALFFSFPHTTTLAALGRFCMGVGSAFSFIGALVLVSRWFPPRYFAMLAGLVQLMSSMGAIAGQGPLAAAVKLFGWRDSFFWLACAGTLLAVVVWLVVRDWPKGHQPLKEHIEQLSLKTSLKQVCGQRQTWLIALYSFCSWAPITAFAALWGIPYLCASYGISEVKASSACSMIWLGIGIGSPIIGFWSDLIGKRCLPLFIVASIGVIAMTCIIYVPVSFSMMFVLLFLFGIAASGQSLSFGVVKDNNSPLVVGAAIGFNNMAVVVGGALFQPIVGAVLHLFWNGQFQDGAPLYTVHNYQCAMLVLPLCYLLACALALKGIKETDCKPAYLI